MRFFPVEAIQVQLHEDLMADAPGLIRRVFEFLGVDDRFEPDMSGKFNQGHSDKILAMHRFFAKDSPVKLLVRSVLAGGWRSRMKGRMQAANRLPRPELTPEMHERFVTVYRDDILRLQNMIGRDLSAWLRPQPASGGRS